MLYEVFLQPEKFDKNEWFILIAGILMMILFLFTDRRISVLEIVVIWVINWFMAEAADFSIAIPPFDLYDFNDSPKYEYFDFFLFVVLYPCTAYLFIHYYDKWNLKGKSLIIYVFIYSLLTVGLEALASVFDVFTYKGWHLIFSFPVYLVVYIINIVIFKFERKHIHKINIELKKA